MKAFIGWVGTIVVACFFAIVLVTIMTPLFAVIERTTNIDLMGISRPNDLIYLGAWIILIFALHWFVFRKRRYKKKRS